MMNVSRADNCENEEYSLENLYHKESEVQKPFCTSAAAVNWVLQKAKEENIPITGLKLQKLLYFMHGNVLRKTSRPLVDEYCQAWTYGPVFPSVYHEYKLNGSKPILVNNFSFMKEYDQAKGVFVFKGACHDAALEEILLETWEKYKDRNGESLSALTHTKDSDNPWQIMRKLSASSGMNRISTPNAIIKSYFDNHPEL
jgi:uncharacterized phage-associated protein